MMKNQITTISAVFVFFVLYAPQPLLPIFADSYHVSIASAGALMTATLIPLAVAPLFYGYLLSAISPIRLLRVALLALGLSCIVFAFSDSYQFAFIIRVVQGLLIPAALTSITTYIAGHSSADRLQKNLSFFITGTILGGLFGRILAGVFASYWDWQTFYYGLAVALTVTAFFLPKKEQHVIKIDDVRLPLKSLGQALSVPGVANIFWCVFCLFFSFVAVLNFLPFMIKDILGNASEMFIGLMYGGFIMGAVTSLNAQRLTNRLGGVKRVMLVGYLLFLIAIACLWVQSVALVFIVLFAFCGAMFLVHTVAAAEVNRRSQTNKSLVNALYVSFYYSGGVSGSYFPGMLYQHYGHHALISGLMIVSGLGLFFLLSLPTSKPNTI